MVHYTIRRYRPRLTLVPRFLLQISYCIVYCCNNDITSTHSWFFRSPAILTSGVCSERIYCSLLSCKGLLCYCTCLTSSDYWSVIWPQLHFNLVVWFAVYWSLLFFASLRRHKLRYIHSCIYVRICLSIVAQCFVTASFLSIDDQSSWFTTRWLTSVNFSPEIFITN